MSQAGIRGVPDTRSPDQAARGRSGLSVCLITFNEEVNVRACLESVRPLLRRSGRWPDEIVVVDSHSTDGTAAICREYTDRVIVRDWPGHVAQKQFAVDQASHEWVFCIDADERVSPALRREIESALQRAAAGEEDADGFAMPRKVFYLGRWITHGGWYPDRKLRLFRKSRGRWGGIDPHDRVILDGKVKRLSGDLHHHTYRDISAHLKQIDTFTTISARQMFQRGEGRAVLRMLGRAPARFVRMYLLRLGFLDGLPGFVIAVLAAYYVFLKYAKLWELQRTAGRDGTDRGPDASA